MSVSNAFTKEEYYPSHFLAQKLNNKASVLLTLGQYDEGIRILTKALELADLEKNRRRAANKQEIAPCNCNTCSLESCLTSTIDDDDDQKPLDEQHQTSAGLVSSSETNDSHHHLQDGETQGNYYANNCTRCDDEMECDDDQYQSSSSSPAAASSSRIATAHDLPHQAVVESSSTTTDDNASSEMKGFVYQRPLLVPQKCIDERHYMGITLSLIILLNLALAHHLKALAALVVPPSHLHVMIHRKTLKVLEQALQLYELAYQLNMDDARQAQQQQQPSSQGSSSTTTNSNDNCDDEYSDTNNNARSFGSLRFTMIISNNLSEIHRLVGSQQKHTMCLQHLLSIIIYMVDCKLVVLDSKDMDGFYDNVRPLMLHDICAKTA